MRHTGISDRLALTVALAALLLAGCSHEAANWKQASLANTAEAYQLFVQQYPRSPEAAQAQARIKQLAEDRDWQVAGAADTRDAYQQFVTQHPDSKWAQEARIRIENFAQAGVTSGAALASASAAPASDAATTPAGGAVASAVQSAPRELPSSPQPAVRKHASRHADARSPASSSALSHGAVSRVRAVAPGRVHAAGRLVQLGSFHSKLRAQSEWRLLSARFSTLKSLRPRYVSSRSHSGQIYRLQVQVSSAAAANGLCATLKKHARPCVRVSA